MLHPAGSVEALKEQLPSFSVGVDSVAYSHVMSGDGEKHWLEPFWGEQESFTNSEVPLFFRRQYYGYPKGKENYYEFNQLVTHPLDLHWSPKLGSYCTIDDQGDEVEKIKIIEHEEVRLILGRKLLFEKLLYLGDWVLVRYFTFSRYNTKYPSFDSCTSKVCEPEEYEAKFNIRISKNDFIEFRGAQIHRPETPKERLLSWEFRQDEEQTENKYASFIVHDWRNKKVLNDYSIDPANFANYFIECELPFETSPIFFKAEVLDKYKGNPDKYDLDERSISCRGGWHLETYDINDHNQVHTYAVYLARLPYKEQLHWLQYNEEPKGPISRRAIQTDFEAKFPDQKSKLQLLRESLEKLGNIKLGPDRISIWAPKGGDWESASKGLYYVNSENANQWHDFVIALANATNEGFKKRELMKVSQPFGNVDNKLGTLGLIKFLLNASGNNDKIPVIHGVLNGLQIKRGRGKAHGTWDTPEGSLIEDGAKTLDDVTMAIEELTNVLEEIEMPDEND